MVYASNFHDAFRNFLTSAIDTFPLSAERIWDNIFLLDMGNEVIFPFNFSSSHTYALFKKWYLLDAVRVRVAFLLSYSHGSSVCETLHRVSLIVDSFFFQKTPEEN